MNILSMLSTAPTLIPALVGLPNSAELIGDVRSFADIVTTLAKDGKGVQNRDQAWALLVEAANDGRLENLFQTGMRILDNGKVLLTDPAVVKAIGTIIDSI